MPSTSDSAGDAMEGHYAFNDFEGAQASMPPPPLGGEYDNSQDLKKAINEFTKDYGYVVNLRGSDINRKGIKDTVYLSEVQVPSSQPPSTQYTVMSSSPSQLYSRPSTQYDGEFTGFTMASTQAEPGRKRRSNTTVKDTNKRAKKSG